LGSVNLGLQKVAGEPALSGWDWVRDHNFFNASLSITGERTFVRFMVCPNK
jgi:hypothetical protein